MLKSPLVLLPHPTMLHPSIVHRFSVLLSMFLTCILSHGYLPDQVMSTANIPILKDKMGDISDVKN